MKFKQFLLFLLIISISVLLYFKRSIPTGQLWDNYTVFYVPDAAEDKIVCSAFEENGIKEFVSLDGQQNPVQLEKGSMAELMFNMNLSNTDNTYLERRLNYFFDSEKQYRIYYVPNRFKDRIEKTVKTLDKQGIYAGVDSSVAFPWMLPVIAVISAFIVMLCVKRKSLFFFGMLVPVYYVFCNPFYSATTAVIIEMIILVYISNLWGKDGAAKRILKNPFIYIVLIISIVSAFAASIFTGFYFIAALLAQFSFVLIASIQVKYKNSRQTYVFINIKPLKMIPLYAGKAKIIFPFMIIGIFGVMLSYKYYSTTNISSHFSKILLPGIAEEHDPVFPVLDEYYEWNWKIASFPHRSLNLDYSENPYEIEFSRYEKEGDEIKQKTEIFALDNKFKKSMYDNIDDLGFNNIEHIIKNQGNNFSCGFTTAKNYQVSYFSIIMIFICFLILIIIYFSAMIKKDGRK